MYKILVVDDEVFVRKGIVSETDWASLNCEVVAEAENGLEALDAVKKYSPDLIISDIRMPKMDGLDFLRTLREEENDVPLIFLTAYSEFEYAKQALRYFACDYLLKPFEDGELEEAVKRVLEDNLGKKAPKQEIASQDVSDKSPYIKEAVAYIESHYSDPDISIGMIAKDLDISEGHLSHLFKKEMEDTISSYITKYRMNMAKVLLKDCRNRISEVSEKVGYKDVAYFSSTFKKIVGENPSEFQSHNA